MTVAELIERLKEFPPYRDVLVLNAGATARPRDVRWVAETQTLGHAPNVVISQ